MGTIHNQEGGASALWLGIRRFTQFLKVNMLRKLWMFAMGPLLCGAAVESQGALISLWTFDSSSASSPITANSGIGAQPTATLTTSGNTTLANAGTTLNDPRTGTGFPAATFRLEYISGSGGNFTLHITGTALSSFQVSYAGENTAGASSSQTWAWSLNNSTFTALGTQPSALGGTFATRTADFSGVTALNGQTDVYLRLSFGEKDAFDNIQVTAVPEPTNMALALFGVGFAAVAMLRKLKAESSRGKSRK